MRILYKIIFRLISLSFLLFLNRQVYSQAIGYTEVSTSVGDNGDARASIPINIPKGTILQPTIALSYNSQSADGIAGIGWNLSNIFQAITRVPATVAQDGEFDPVDFDALDRFTLNGERLKSINGIYGTTNVEYRTEQNNFSRIISYNDNGFGPEKFRVWTKDGLIVDFGITADSRIEAAGTANKPLIWLVSRIYDTNGNFISFSYEENNITGDYRPVAIYYTGRYAIDNAGNTTVERQPYNTIILNYEDRQDKPVKYLVGYPTEFSKRLSAIIITDNGNSYRRYKLDYKTDVGVSKLAKVTEYGTDDVTALKAVEIQWSTEAVTPILNNINYESWAVYDGTIRNYQTGDFDGDGLTDIVAYLPEAPGGTQWVVGYSTGKDFAYVVWNGLGARSNNTILGDFNGDGKTDIATYIGGTSSSNWQILYSYDRKTPFHYWGKGVISGPEKGPDSTIGADFDGDGRADLAYYKGGRTWEIYFSREYNFEKDNYNFEKKVWTGTDVGLSKIIVADFNGDGRADLAGVKGNDWEICLSSKDNFIVSTWTGPSWFNYNQYSPTYSTNPVDYTKVGDFNGDGISDLLTILDTQVNISFSTGTGFYNVKITPPVAGRTNWSIGDFNGDGKTDWIWPNNSSTNPGYTLYLSNGQTFQSFTYTGSTLNQNSYPPKIADYNGDGTVDLGQYTGSQWSMNLSNPNKHLVSSVKNGNGATLSFVYSPITSSDIYTVNGNGFFAYPYVSFSVPIYVVKTHSNDNGVGGKHNIAYEYEDGAYDLTGRGFRGFLKIIQRDTLANVVSITNYARRHYFIGANILSIEQRTVDGKILKKVENYIQAKQNISNQDPLSNSGNGYYLLATPSYGDFAGPITSKGVYTANYILTTEKTYELDGTEISSKETHFDEYDNYNNLTKIVEIWSNNYWVVTYSKYDNDTITWHLSRLKESTVVKILPEPFDQRSKTSRFTYDNNGNLIQEILLSDYATRKLQTDYTLDANGNRTKVTQSGPDIITRSDQNIYDLYGRNIIKSTNPLGHTQSFTYTNNLTTAISDPNGRITKITRDVFGREIRTDNPDGTWATLTHINCSSSTCPTQAVYLIENELSGRGKSRNYYDLLDRKIRDETTGYDGKNIYVDYAYNADGTIKSVSDPYYQGMTIQLNTKEYDVVKRLIKETAPGNRQTTYQYNGLTTSIINPQNQKLTRTYSPQGKLLVSTDNQNKSIKYAYDSDLNTISIQDPQGNKIITTFDIRGFKSSLTDPNLGGIYTYKYNTLGLLVSQTNPAGEVTNLEYDVLNRMTTRAEKEGITTWTYDPSNSIGNVNSISVTTNNSSQLVTRYLYDDNGRLKSSLSVRGSNTKAFSYSYNTQSGLLETLTYPNSFSVKYSYQNGYLAQIQDNSTNAILWRAMAYDAESRTTLFTLGNNLQTIRNYDLATGFLTSVKTGTNNNVGSIQDHQFTFSAIGNLTARSDFSLNLGENFQYDDLNRLVKSQVTGKTAVNIAYDQIGNIVYKSDVGLYSYGGNGTGSQVLTSIDHSIVPNCVYQFNYQATFTSYNYISGITNGTTTVGITYGPGRERTGLTVKKNDIIVLQKIYIEGLYEESTDNTGKTTQICFIKAGNDIVAYRLQENSSFKITYIHTDHLGSVIAVTNQSGILEQRYSYDAWGKQRNPTTWDNYITPPNLPINQRGFTFHEMLDIDWLICMNARVYNPILGRFLSPDSFIQDTEDLQSLNRFAYVGNSPLSFTDPTGHLKIFKSIGNFIRRNLGTIVSIAIVVGTGGWGTAYGFAGILASGAAAGFGGAFTNALVSGDSFGGAFRLGLQGGAWGAVNAGATFGIGHSLNISGTAAGVAGKTFLHGAFQGIMSEVRGGDFRDGFIGGIVGGLGGDSPILALIAGGTASELTGGKFADGAFAASLVAIYNHGQGENSEQGSNADAITPVYPLESLIAAVGGGYIIRGIGISWELIAGTVEGIGSRAVDQIRLFAARSILKDGMTVGTEKALKMAGDFLGKGYKESIKGSGRYISQDGTRVVRMGESDILGQHGGGPHLNFETLGPNPAKPGKVMVTNNAHVFLKD